MSFASALHAVVDAVGKRKPFIGKAPDRVDQGDFSYYLSGTRVPGYTVMLRICRIAAAHPKAADRVPALIRAWQVARSDEDAVLAARLAEEIDIELPPARQVVIDDDVLALAREIRQTGPDGLTAARAALAAVRAVAPPPEPHPGRSPAREKKRA